MHIKETPFLFALLACHRHDCGWATKNSFDKMVGSDHKDVWYSIWFQHEQETHTYSRKNMCSSQGWNAKGERQEPKGERQVSKDDGEPFHHNCKTLTRTNLHGVQQ